MRRFFVDAFYWIALLSPRDQWHARVQAFSAALVVYHFYITDEVLTEFLAFYSAAAPLLRARAASFVRVTLQHPHSTVLPQTHTGFLDGLTLYEARLGKTYSLTDCISMQVMRREGLTDVLTNDHHFTQEGFHILFPISVRGATLTCPETSLSGTLEYAAHTPSGIPPQSGTV